MAGLRDNTLRMVLVGRTGSGKSATANTILGRRAFDSRTAAESVTKHCQKEERVWEGRKLVVVDTPGLFDTKEALWTTCKEISQCVVQSCPGPHAIILVVQLGRMTEEECKTFQLMKAIFGEAATKHMIVLFTHKEKLGCRDLSAFIAEAGRDLKDIIKECDLRCCAFSNKSADEAENEAQVQGLVELVDLMVRENGGAHFSDPIYKATEETWKCVEKSLNKISAEQEAMEKEVAKAYARKEISQAEMEKRMASIKEEYGKKWKSVREEGEENTLPVALKMIWRLLSKIWDSFWK